MARYKIADVVIDGEFLYKYTAKLCENYLYNGDEKTELVIKTVQADIDAEKKLEGAEEFPDAYLESLAVFRKLCVYVLSEKQGLVFHCSALAVDGKAYLFTAPSGTGKSTHARLWREVYKDKVVMVNDDKPICHLVRGAENSIKAVSAGEMLGVMLNQTLRPDSVTEIDKMLGLIDGLLRKVRLYKLKCNMSEDAARTAYKVLVGKE